MIGAYQNVSQKDTELWAIRHMLQYIQICIKIFKASKYKICLQSKGKSLARGVGYGLEISVIYMFNEDEKNIEWLKSKNEARIKQELKYLKKNIQYDLQLTDTSY